MSWSLPSEPWAAACSLLLRSDILTPWVEVVACVRVVVCPTRCQSLGYSKPSLAARLSSLRKVHFRAGLADRLWGGKHSTGLGSLSILCPFLQDVTTQSVMGFDPLPPPDTIYSYTRPERYPSACFLLLCFLALRSVLWTLGLLLPPDTGPQSRVLGSRTGLCGRGRHRSFLPDAERCPVTGAAHSVGSKREASSALLVRAAQWGRHARGKA